MTRLCGWQDLDRIIDGCRLKADETRTFMHGAFEFGQVRTESTTINVIMRPMSRFNRNVSYDGVRAKASRHCRASTKKHRGVTDTFPIES